MPVLIGMSVLLLGLTSSAATYSDLRLTILFNNVPYDERLTTKLGFSCVVHGTERTILFDTGGKGNVLLSNMEKLKVSPQEVGLVVLSHVHRDHTGGLKSFLKKNRHITVYLPRSFPNKFKDDIKTKGAKVVSVDEPVEICKGVYSSGEMDNRIREQCLILKTREGLVIITGCAHPGIVPMVKHAQEWLKDEIYVVIGGFHLREHSEREVKEIIAELRQIGVKKIAPSHCTGEAAIRLFKEAWGQDFLDSGCGAVITIP
jgi:7,8-dihydropterin-6-yl-methyl-4-(beta-D-ribofuranosyl)aminobenzene 5'-phosphate synthase